MSHCPSPRSYASRSTVFSGVTAKVRQNERLARRTTRSALRTSIGSRTVATMLSAENVSGGVGSGMAHRAFVLLRKGRKHGFHEVQAEVIENSTQRQEVVRAVIH
jgi:hypothetical protein